MLAGTRRDRIDLGREGSETHTTRAPGEECIQAILGKVPGVLLRTIPWSIRTRAGRRRETA